MPLNLTRSVEKAPEVEEPKVEVVVEAEDTASAAEAAPAEDASSVLGIWSDKIAFVKPLTYPLRDDTVTKEINGVKTQVKTPFIVGYRFKALADLQGIPDCGMTEGFKKEYMNYDDINRKRDVKAGEEFDMTPFEMALLASFQEVNGRFNGGDKKAVCAYTTKEVKAKTGDASVVTTKEFPRAVLRLTEQHKSIKDDGYINVCEKVITMGADGKEVKVAKLNEGFEKWEPLCRVTKRSGARGGATGTGAARKAANKYDKGARMFQELARSKGYVR